MSPDVTSPERPAVPALQWRLRAIVSRVRARELARVEGGDLLFDEILAPLGVPRSAEEIAICCEAQLLRASLYAASTGATALDAADALIAADRLGTSLPRHARRERQLVRIAWRLRGELIAISSRRTLSRILAILARAWSGLKPRRATARMFLWQLPKVLAEVSELAEDPGLAEILAGARSLSEAVEDQSAILEVERATALAWLDLGRPERALGLGLLDRVAVHGRASEFAIALADRGLTGAEATAFYQRVAGGDPRAERNLAPALMRIAHVGQRLPLPERLRRERLNQALLPVYGGEGWPYRNLSLGAAHRGRGAEALGAFLAASERGAEVEDLWPLVVASLSGLGFHRLAREVLSEEVRAFEGEGLMEACEALSACADLIADSEALVGPIGRERLLELEDLTGRFRLWPVQAAALERARAELHSRRGEHEAAARVLLALYDHRGGDRELALALAESALHAGDHALVRRVLEESVPTPCRRRCLLEARLAAAAGEELRALDSYEAAIACESSQSDASDHLAEQLGAVFRSHAEQSSGAWEEDSFAARMLQEVERSRSRRRRPRPERERRALLLEAAELAARTGQPKREGLLLGQVARPSGAVLLRMARAALLCGERQEAQEVLKRLPAKVAARPEAQLLAALVAAADGLLEQASEHLLRTEGLGPQAMVAQAWVAAHAGKSEEALSALDGLPANAPSELLAWGLEIGAWCEEELCRFERALALRQRLVALDPDPKRQRELEALEARARAAGGASDARAASPHAQWTAALVALRQLADDPSDKAGRQALQGAKKHLQAVPALAAECEALAQLLVPSSRGLPGYRPLGGTPRPTVSGAALEAGRRAWKDGDRKAATQRIEAVFREALRQGDEDLARSSLAQLEELKRERRSERTAKRSRVVQELLDQGRNRQALDLLGPREYGEAEVFAAQRARCLLRLDRLEEAETLCLQLDLASDLAEALYTEIALGRGRRMGLFDPGAGTTAVEQDGPDAAAEWAQRLGRIEDAILRDPRDPTPRWLRAVALAGTGAEPEAAAQARDAYRLAEQAGDALLCALGACQAGREAPRGSEVA